jgi:hypothetical protein
MGRRLAAKFPSFREKIDLPMRGGANFGLLEVPINENQHYGLSIKPVNRKKA